MSLNELAYDLLNIIRGGKSVNTESISIEQIKFWIINTRAQFIRNEMNKQRTIDPSIIQDLGCIELEKVNAALCCNVELGCDAVRTKVKIPGFIELHQRPLITRIGPVDRTKPGFTLISLEQAPYEFLNKFTKNLIKAFILEDYVYIIYDKDNYKAKLLDTINIQGVFEDPREVAGFKCNGDEDCYNDDKPFPLKSWMVESLKQQILKANLQIAASAPSDDIADGKHGVTPQQER